MKYLLTIITCVCLGCDKKQASINNGKEKVITINSISNYDSLTNAVIEQGNVDAYDELFFHFMDGNATMRTDTCMYYSKIMAEKYKNETAYNRYLWALLEKHDIVDDVDNYKTLDISSLSQSQKKQIDDWLKKMLDRHIITLEQYNSIKR
jgi:hypothetical protein